MHTRHRSGRVIPSHGPCLRNSSSRLITQLRRRHLCRLCQVCFITFELELVTLIKFYLSVDTDVPMREWFARNASANESSLSLFKQSLKGPLGTSNVSFPQCF